MADPTTAPRPAGDLHALLTLLRDRLAQPPELLSREALAGLLDLGVSTLDKLRETGAIGPRPVRLGGSIRWYRPEVLAWLARRAPGGDLFDASTWPEVWADLQRRAAGN